ncbi:TIGR01459 family HAD-type hydrolase [Zhengella mangrovi]|uniref:TIGR01459 family HAD-type hydrolase n=1 Tax=Zhengella mangrovi TaxID=1982044 RepID=A0A2G1QL71_9HYPH|nr:TIGR01459 family HAD-type hydrolase [Zhengella mangrovi]PHP66219.1 TIGR01459 family HAD-type hydrolase [Zhengella mangrovi]
MTASPAMIDRLDDLAGSYGAILCDVWGVIHNGVRAFPQACAALGRMRAAGLPVVLLTNAPRLSSGVITQIRGLGVPDDAWDAVVTSGDVTRDLIAEGPRRVFHLGPDRDLQLFDGLEVDLVEEFEASAVVCTGLFDDETETPDDYREMLQRLRSRDLPMICANPDIVVERGDRMIWCSGALARDYGQLGGRTLISGKPHAPIYRAAMAKLAELSDRPLERGEVLAIGDGMLTDIKGAVNAGIDALYVSGGIHFRDYGDSADTPDPVRLGEFFERHALAPVASITRLA